MPLFCERVGEFPRHPPQHTFAETARIKLHFDSLTIKATCVTAMSELGRSLLDVFFLRVFRIAFKFGIYFSLKTTNQSNDAVFCCQVVAYTCFKILI